jgi:predicted ester cyclase
VKLLKLSFVAVLFLSTFQAVVAGQATQASASAAAPQTSPQAAPSPTTQTPAQPVKSAETPSAENQPADTMPRRYVELWNTGNFDQMDSLFSAPVAMVSRGNRILLRPDMLKGVISAWRKSMPDLNFKIDDTIVQGDKVAMRLSFTGSYKERLFAGTAAPTPEIPRTVRASEMLMFHLKNGKIDQIWEEYDEVRMRLEMGGSWHSNAELDAAAGRSSKPAPSGASPPKP